MIKNRNPALAFDDILLEPQFSNLKSREEVKLTSALKYIGAFELPVIASPMDTVTESAMVNAMHHHGATGIIHRYNSIEEQADLVSATKNPSLAGVAVGVTGDFLMRAQRCYEAGSRLLCVDVAHGHHRLVAEALNVLRNHFGKSVHIMAGNIATRRAYEDLISWGADSVRVGIGGGSICSTRVQTGHGIPTLQSVLDCSESLLSDEYPIIADGGIKNSGDVVKALAAGANFVMLGSMLAGTFESPGEIINRSTGDGFKIYRGMASREAQSNWRGTIRSVEGISTTIPFKGSVSTVLKELTVNVKSGLSYSGASSLKELRETAAAIVVTTSGVVENSTHINKL